jgi:hypothetical protein
LTTDRLAGGVNSHYINGPTPFNKTWPPPTKVNI